METAEKIRQLRKRKRMTQKQLAEKAGLAVTTIQQYEAGKYRPKLEACKKLAAALDVGVSEITNVYTTDADSLNENIVLQKKLDSGQPLTGAEIIFLLENKPEVFRRLQASFEQLNDDGVEALCAQMEEHAKLLAQVPQYQKENE
ncbi:MAG: helix-turn-helix domain-containing protein [Clostridiales bacterium]|nr:helix-turn-helix domain-containing protein [Clostridiales bacterium]